MKIGFNTEVVLSDENVMFGEIVVLIKNVVLDENVVR